MDQNQNDNNWECAICDKIQDYYYKKCQSCHTEKQQFCRQMQTDCILYVYDKIDMTNYDEYFKNIMVIDFTCNESQDRSEIVELLICKISLISDRHTVNYSKQFIIKPYLIPIIQRPEICSITQKMADDGTPFQDTFKQLDGDVFIFESSQKAQLFYEQCQNYHLQCPITEYIEMKRVFPITSQTSSLNIFSMLKILNIPYEVECFSLAEIVDELYNRCYRFLPKMKQTMQFPIPEEENRIKGFENLIILDFEGTCLKEKDKTFKQEIIEFPFQIYNISENKILTTYQEYIKPIENPQLSDFCIELTGITQNMVNKGISLKQAIEQFQIETKKLGRCCVITCGDFDLLLLKGDASRKGIQISDTLKYYINLKKIFPKKLWKNKNKEPTLIEMLESCGLTFDGRQHSGIDDTKNTTKIVDYLIKNENFKFDERMISYTFKF